MEDRWTGGNGVDGGASARLALETWDSERPVPLTNSFCPFGRCGTTVPGVMRGERDVMRALSSDPKRISEAQRCCFEHHD